VLRGFWGLIESFDEAGDAAEHAGLRISFLE